MVTIGIMGNMTNAEIGNMNVGDFVRFSYVDLQGKRDTWHGEVVEHHGWYVKVRTHEWGVRTFRVNRMSNVAIAV